jgi:phage terminase small subunit
LTKPDIQVAIAAQQRGREERANATSDEVLREINRMAMIDPIDLVDVKSPEDIKTLPESVRRAIVGWKWDRNGRFMIELAKQSAVDMLARHHSLFNDKLKIDATVKGQVAYKANIPAR